jgi:hypothetical protein
VVLAGDRDSLGPTGFGDGTGGEVGIELARCSRPAAGRRRRHRVPNGAANAAQGEEVSVERSRLGRLIQGLGSMKSVKQKDGSGEPPARGFFDHRSDAWLHRKGKGKETKPCLVGHGADGEPPRHAADARLTLVGRHAARVAHRA